MEPHPNRELIVHSNYFPVRFTQPIYKYVIQVESPDPLPPTEHNEVIRKNCLQNKANRGVIAESLGEQFLFLNGAIYSPLIVSIPIELSPEEDKPDIKVTIVQDCVIDFAKDSDSFKQISGRLMRILLKKLRLKQIGAKLFDPSKYQTMDMFEVWPGFASVLAFASGKCYLNVDIASKIITNVNVLDLMNRLKQRASHDLEAVLAKELIGKSVMTVYNRRFYRVDRIAFDKTPSCTIDLHDGTSKSFLEYYLEKYKRKIEVVDQPMLVNIDRKTSQEIFLVPELCVITGLSDEQRANRNLMIELDKIIKPDPGQRLNRTKDLVDVLQQNEATRSLLNLWNLQIESTPMKVPGSKIDAGRLLMGGQRSIDIENSQNLDRDIQGKFYQSKNFKTLAVFYPRMCTNEYNTLRDMTQNIFGQLQINCDEFKGVEIQDFRNFEQVKGAAFATLNPNVTACIWILPGNKKNGTHYDKLKRLLINTLPVPSQMIIAKTISANKNLRSILTKLYIQVCAKIGGIPWAISEMPFSEKPAMVIGLDLQDKINNKQSIYSMVATVNNTFSAYWSNSVFGGNDMNIETFIRTNLPRAVEKFNKDNGILPHYYIIFRDGVSVGQRDTVKDKEIVPIRETLQKSYEGSQIKPSLLFITTNKRSNSKFFYSPQNSNDPRTIQNPLPGTFISKEICPDQDEFYLLAQKTFRGLASPTNFYILANDFTQELKIPIETVKERVAKLAYKLCYLYYNTSGSIKVPAPIHYAQKLTTVIETGSAPNEKIVPHSFLSQIASLYFI